MCVDQARFEHAINRVVGLNREQMGIGTLGEKSVHAVLKNYYAPNVDFHEVPIEGFVADIFTGTEIFEIQTRSLDALRRKLAAFLPLYPVTVVHPVAREKRLIWIDPESGEADAPRKSPKHGTPYQAFLELRKIRQFLCEPNLHIRIVMLDMDEYRLKNGWGPDRKNHGGRYDKVPTLLVEEISIDRREDYMQFVPYALADAPDEKQAGGEIVKNVAMKRDGRIEEFSSSNEAKIRSGQFTAKDFAASVKIPIKQARDTLLVLTEVGVVERVGKDGQSYIYTAVDS